MRKRVKNVSERVSLSSYNFFRSSQTDRFTCKTVLKSKRSAWWDKGANEEEEQGEEEEEKLAESGETHLHASDLKEGGNATVEQSTSEAFNPETGEINWDCPCLGGMAHGPCGPQFKEAFSCFVHSDKEPKGVDCIEKFKGMQECFREHPDVYGEGKINFYVYVMLLLITLPQKSMTKTRRTKTKRARSPSPMHLTTTKPQATRLLLIIQRTSTLTLPARRLPQTSTSSRLAFYYFWSDRMKTTTWLYIQACSVNILFCRLI
jgi:hypothetical protein